MALYQLPKQTLTQLRLNVKGGAGQSVNSLLPLIFHNFLERLANPSPTYHILRSPFLRPLRNKKASKLPIYNLLSPVHTPSPEDLAPDSPLQQQLVNFFQEKQLQLLNGISVEESMPVWVYCMHRRRILGPPQLVINEGYNTAILKAGKRVAVMHAISVLSHQFSLMLQAEADPKFRVTTSRRPSDIDKSQEFNAHVRASFADFQLEKRGNVWQLAGALQPSPLPLEGGPAPVAAEEAALFFKPRALIQEKITQWSMLWERGQWDPRADLGFFTKETTVPWETIDDTQIKRIHRPDGPVQVRVATRSRRPISFAPPMTAWELTGDHSPPISRKFSDSLGENDFLSQGGDWESDHTVRRTERRQANWVERLTAKDLDMEGDASAWRQPPRAINKSRRAREESRRPMAPLTGANHTPVGGTGDPTLPVFGWSHALPASEPSKREKVLDNSKAARGPRFSREAAPHEGGPPEKS